MSKIKLLFLIASFSFLLPAFGQTKVDSLMLENINAVRTGKKISELTVDPKLYEISNEYAKYVREYFHNMKGNNFKHIFDNTRDIFSEILYDNGVCMETTKECYVFFGSKKQKYNDENLSETLFLYFLNKKFVKEYFLDSKDKNIGISCISEQTFEFKQVIFCIVIIN
jgi:hypothetical protein